MKYSDSNKPMQCFMRQSTCYKGTAPMKVKGILWHSTGANNPTLKRYVQPDDSAADRDALLAVIGKNKYGNDWNHTEVRIGLNCWIGKLEDGTVTTLQTMPWDYKPWGCGKGGKGSCNNGWIQFEICEDGLTDADYFTKAYQEACEITAYLCQMFGIDPKGTTTLNGVTVPTILCHADSYKLGLGSNHSDIYNWFPKHGKSMTTARDDVAALLNSAVSTPAPEPSHEPAPEPAESVDKVIWDYLLGKGFNECAVAGIMGNLYHESRLRPNNLQGTSEIKLGMTDDSYTAAVDNGTYTNFVKDSAGYGLAQWTYWSRKQALLNFARKRGTSIGDLQMQLEYLWSEIQGYTTVMTKLKGATTVKTASDAVLTGYECPYDQGDKVKATRANQGQVYYDKYATAAVAPVAASEPSPATFSPYLVKVTATVLNIRSKPTTDSSVVGKITDKGVYTIVDEAEGKGAPLWGKLKSGAGWISLYYTKRV